MSAVKHLPLFVSWTVILSCGTGEDQQGQSWSCNYLSGCDSCIPSQLCAILLHLLQHGLIRGIEQQVGSSTFSSQCLVPNLCRDRREQTQMSLRDLSRDVYRPAAPSVPVRTWQLALHQCTPAPAQQGLHPTMGMNLVQNRHAFNTYWELV